MATEAKNAMTTELETTGQQNGDVYENAFSSVLNPSEKHY